MNSKNKKHFTRRLNILTCKLLQVLAETAIERCFEKQRKIHLENFTRQVQGRLYFNKDIIFAIETRRNLDGKYFYWLKNIKTGKKILKNRFQRQELYSFSGNLIQFFRQFYIKLVKNRQKKATKKCQVVKKTSGNYLSTMKTTLQLINRKPCS